MTLTLFASEDRNELLKSPLALLEGLERTAEAPRVLDRFSEVSVMDELAETEDGEGDDSDDEAARTLGGLHAKVFVQEHGWDTSITVGSGNATRPALLTGRNVEVFATLTGKRSRVGCISEIFGPGGFGRVFRPTLSGRPSPERRPRLRVARRRSARRRPPLPSARRPGAFRSPGRRCAP